MSRKPLKAVRYWPGKAPEILDQESSSEPDEEILQEDDEKLIVVQEKNHNQDDEEERTKNGVPIHSKFKSISEKLLEQDESNSEEEGDYDEGEERRRALLRMRALKLRQQDTQESDASSDEENDNEDDKKKTDHVINIIERSKIINKSPIPHPKSNFPPDLSIATVDVESSSSSSSEESSSEEEDDSLSEDQPVILKPVFIPKKHRETVLEKERIEKESQEAEEKRQQQMEERKRESHKLAQDVIKQELSDLKDDKDVPDVDDTDGTDEEAEYAAWKLRELKRVKRDRLEQAQRDQEIFDIERRRGMTDAEILAEDDKSKLNKEKGKIKFLQKYYHKGAFFADEDILQRDFNAPTLEDKFDKSSLPAVMQVKNFGKMGRTKWTHLANEDTSQMDAGWAKNSETNKRALNKLGGLKSSISSSKKQKTE